MQQRRLGPGDVLDDYCPRERRVTDHAIVAMIDDNIKQTRCVVCDAEHEYKQAKVPAQRKKNAPALFKQVLDGLQAPARPPQVPGAADEDLPEVESAPVAAADASEAITTATVVPFPAAIEPEIPVSAAPAVLADDVSRPLEDKVEAPLFRRQLIRAALPRPEGTPPPARAIPEFTIRQPMGRPNRSGGARRRGQHQAQGHAGMRFGRGNGNAPGHGQRSSGHGRPPGGHNGNRPPHGNRAGGSRRGGKKR